jgi:VIT1/CCC1 family predicted Fe2+/Mn2+ transporter
VVDGLRPSWIGCWRENRPQLDRAGKKNDVTTHEPAHDPAAEAEGGRIASRLNWLRAGVLGANDGIVSTAGIVVGVAGATVDRTALLAAGVAAVVAGAMSMAVGEYVSVSSQRDSQKAEIEHERMELAQNPEYGLVQLTDLVQAQGIDRDLAHQVAVQLTRRDALTAHARYELGIDPDELTNPWQAAFASMVSFILGAIIPLAAILLSTTSTGVPVTAFAVVVSLILTGAISAHLGKAPRLPATLRNVGGGLLAMAVTYGIGALVGTQI